MRFYYSLTAIRLQWARTVATQQTNIGLDIHLQTCVAHFNPTCLSRLLPYLFLSLLIAGNVKWWWLMMMMMMIATNFCWWIVTLTWSYYHNSLMLLFHYLPAKLNFFPVLYQSFWLETSFVVLFASLVPKTQYTSNKFFQIRFVHYLNTQIIC